MNIVIIGCGRVGSTLARMMYRDGHNVTIVDQQSESFRRLGTKFKGARIIGNGIDEDVMRRAGIENADVLIAVTQGDNRNIMAAQIAQHIFHMSQKSWSPASTIPSAPTATDSWASPRCVPPRLRPACCAIS